MLANNNLTGSNLSAKVALVTGASRGIGSAIAIALAQSGAFVFVNYSSNAEAAAQTVAACGGSDKAEALQFNVASSEEVDKAVSEIISKKGRLDILVNNAGISHDGLLIRFKDEAWKKTLETNLDGAFYCGRAAAKHMLKARQGRIINIGSVVGEMGNAGQVAYVSSKAGLIGMTKSMAKELGSRSITVNVITPGFIDTDMTKTLSPETIESYKSAIPLGRFGTPDEIAQTALFLASDAAAYITGQIIGVNGGMYM